VLVVVVPVDNVEVKVVVCMGVELVAATGWVTVSVTTAPDLV